MFPHPIAFNVVPQCMGFTESGYTVEELKLRDEPRKILGLPELASHPTCVRVPVLVGHSLSVRAVCAEPVDLEAFRAGCRAAPGLTVVDDPDAGRYPTPLECAGTDGVFVGRIRADLADPRARALLVGGRQPAQGRRPQRGQDRGVPPPGIPGPAR